jgi:hypothetical protein
MDYRDDEGRVLAMKDTKVKDPWVVRASGRYPGNELRLTICPKAILKNFDPLFEIGRYFFFNTEETKTVWALDPSFLEESDPSCSDVACPSVARKPDVIKGESVPECFPILATVRRFPNRFEFSNS